MTKRGRKSKPYRCTWNGETIDGLYRYPKGDRWRINATGYEFREADERQAIARFRQWQRSQQGDVIEVETPIKEMGSGQGVVDAMDVGASLVGKMDGSKAVKMDVPESVLFPWLRQMLLTKADYIAEKVGIPQLASLADLPLPRKSVKLNDLWRGYERYNKADNKRHIRLAWDELVKLTGAETVRELTTEKLLAYGDKVREGGHSASYCRDKFQRVQRVIRFGLKRGMDAVEIRSCLDRCKVLDAGEIKKEYKPSPIAIGDFKRLLDAAEKAENDILTAALLVSLNCCMYASEVVGIEWDDLDLEAGTLLTKRNKTGIIRTATLWDRTIAALRRLPQSPGAVFKSSRGAAYVPSSLRDMFNDLRSEAGVGEAVQFSHMRDGAYTAAVSAGVEFALVQVLAGHKTLGLADHYIARNPGMVRDACDAVERHYFGPQKAEKGKRKTKAEK